MSNEQAVSSHLGGAFSKKPRSSNLELYRIICMMLIVAHHYVLTSFLANEGPLTSNANSINSMFLWLFGAWGKTGINCFMMITGYFMCTSEITIRKFVKLLAQIYFYQILFYAAFLFAGYECFSITRLIKVLMPFWGFGGDFTGCFIVFYLTIPFWTILVKNMSKRQHELLLLLMLGCYTLLGSVPTFKVTFNYITWFGIIFLIASYIRLYPIPLFERKSLWGWLTLITVAQAMASVVVLQKKLGANYFYLSDCNKFFAVTVAVCSFLWFKNMDMPYSKTINKIGASTFGVLLIHANSEAMRTWLWTDTINASGHFNMPLPSIILFSIGVVIAVFFVCNLIDQLRVQFLEKPFLSWYDKNIDNNLNKLIR